MRAGRRRKPLAIGNAVEPRNCHHRLLRMTEGGIAAVRRRRVPGGVQKPRVLPNSDLRCRHGEGIYPDAMNRPFHILTAVGPHGKPASRDLNARWFSVLWTHGGGWEHRSVRC